jgi:hypothetical protein
MVMRAAIFFVLLIGLSGAVHLRARAADSTQFVQSCVAENSSGKVKWPVSIEWTSACGCQATELTRLGYNVDRFRSEMSAGMAIVVAHPHTDQADKLLAAYTKRSTDAALALQSCIQRQIAAPKRPAGGGK